MLTDKALDTLAVLRQTMAEERDDLSSALRAIDRVLERYRPERPNSIPPAEAATRGRHPLYDWERGYQLWKDGMGPKAIAAALGCKPASIKNHVDEWKARLVDEGAIRPAPQRTIGRKNASDLVECPDPQCQQMTDPTNPHCTHCHQRLPTSLRVSA